MQRVAKTPKITQLVNAEAWVQTSANACTPPAAPPIERAPPGSPARGCLYVSCTSRYLQLVISIKIMCQFPHSAYSFCVCIEKINVCPKLTCTSHRNAREECCPLRLSPRWDWFGLRYQQTCDKSKPPWSLSGRNGTSLITETNVPEKEHVHAEVT